ncbi:MAG: cytochrome c biogenesis protein [Planctomycetota bacterium]|jgi:ABC-type transport system involved in cytochrome c biogenesis permease subunit
MSFYALTVATIVAAQPAPSEPRLPDSLDLEAIRALPVQHDGRWPPLDTVARDIVESTTGTAFFEGHDPVLWLLAWTFEPEKWRGYPLISITPPELREELDLPLSKEVFSCAELLGHRPFLELIREVSQRESPRKLDALKAEAVDIRNKLMTLQGVFFGQAIRLIPDPADIFGKWHPVGSAPSPPHGGSASSPHGSGPETSPGVQTAWTALKEAFLQDDAAAFTKAAEQLAAELAKLPAAHRPDPKLIDLELRYNKLQPFSLAWMVMLGGAALAAAAIAVRRRWFDAVAVVGMLAGFAVLTYGLSMRWQIAGRIPAANMYESLLFLSWGMGAFAIVSVFALRDRIVPLNASAMGALALFLADRIPGMDHFIRPIKPVLLDTVWMSIHVPVIMVSYSVLALAVVIAHVQLVVMAAAPRRRQLIEAADSLHYWYVHVGAILLVAGIITGSMWGSSSWGRYWGWDPKEVWSLVAFLGYLAILHGRLDRAKTPPWLYGVAAFLCVVLFALVVPRLKPPTETKLTETTLLALGGTLVAMLVFVLARGRFATALKSILAFWLIVMTYVGVNYLLGTGLHSYGFGKGEVAYYLFWIGGIDLALIAVLTAVYFIRIGAIGDPGEGEKVAAA